jgi:pyruvate formate lyase activating enzyme
MNGETVGKDVTVDEVLNIVERDRPYYQRSGGGLTLSGGEALRQPGFTRELLQAAKEKGMHTAMESTCLTDYAEIEKILPYLDLLLMDIKHIDPAKHERFTGKRNDKALENIRKLTDKIRVVVRVPVVPGFNATIDEIKAIAVFAKRAAGVGEIHLLPYHRLGEGKYAALGREYAMRGTEPPGDVLMEELKNAVTAVGLRCQIGG